LRKLMYPSPSQMVSQLKWLTYTNSSSLLVNCPIPFRSNIATPETGVGCSAVGVAAVHRVPLLHLGHVDPDRRI
jgi:hypothetical protein